MSNPEKHVFKIKQKTFTANATTFNVTTNKNKTKVMTDHILCNFKFKLCSIICNSNQQ